MNEKDSVLSLKKELKENVDEIKYTKKLIKQYNKQRIGTGGCYHRLIDLLHININLFKRYQTAKKDIIKSQNKTKYHMFHCSCCNNKWLAKCSVCGKWSKYMYNNDYITLCDDEKCIKISGYDDLNRDIWEKPSYIGGCEGN